MKQLELISKRAKPKFCDYLFLKPTIRKCNRSAVITVKGGAYCSAHAEEAQRRFGQGKPIYA